MKTLVNFRSSKFPPYEADDEGEEEEINPGVWGKRLAEYLSQKLRSYDIQTDELVMEDWGCYLPILNEGFRLALCCGYQSGDDEFIIFTDPKTPKIRKFFRVIDITPQLTKLIDAVREILENDPDIREIKWKE